MTWSKGELGWWGDERVQVTRSSRGTDSYGDGTVDVQLVDADGNPKPAKTAGAIAYHEHVPERDLSRLSPEQRKAADEKNNTPPPSGSTPPASSGVEL